MIKIFLLIFYFLLPLQTNANEEMQPISNLEDLKNKKIGVMLGSTHDAFAHKQYPEADILQ